VNKSDQNVLVDSFGRHHDYLRISLTERCNLRCVYCMPEQGVVLQPQSHFMTREELVHIASVFVKLGVKKIRLTGGEPLVRKDVEAVIEDLAKLPVKLAISTNGVLVNQFIQTFKKCNLKAINISLDSLREDRFNLISRRTYFEAIINNVELLIEEGFHLKLNAVLMKGFNDDELIDFIEFTRNRPVHFRFIEFMPFNGNQWDWSKGFAYHEMMDNINAHYGATVVKLEDCKNDTSKSYKVEGFKGTFAVISTVTNPFCDTCNRIRLTADGKIKNCLFSANETDLLTALRSGKEIEESIRESIWNKKSTRGGMETFEEFSNKDLNQKNRSMINIGG